MLKNLSVLLVEDDKTTQEELKMLLEDEVKEVYQAYDAEHALELFKICEPDIVLSDISLPGINGLEMAEEIKKMNPKKPVVLISAFDETKYFLKAINSIGVEFYLLKPIDINDLLNKLKLIARELKEKKEHFNIAYYDPLTNIYNRRMFKKKIYHLIECNLNFTLFFIDLDDFKQINDTYGHVAGDEVLQIFVRKIQNIIRKNDVFIRMGGDEFAVIFENLKEKTIEKIAQKIINSISVVNIEGLDIKISCSIGIKKYNNETIKEFLNKADEALYYVKKHGKGNYYIIE